MRKIVIKSILLLTPVLFLISCNNLGTEKNFKGIQLFYTSEIRETLADSVGNFLVEQGFSDGDTKTIQLTKPENTYEFRMVVKKGIEQDQEYCDMAKDMGALLSTTFFGGSPVDVHFCDENMETLKVIPMGEITQTSNNETEVYETDEFSVEYPKDWKFDNSGVSGTIFMMSAPNKENINLIIQDLAGQNMDLDGFVKLSEDQINTVLTDGVLKENKRISKGNQDCQKMIYTATQGQLKLYFEQYYWVINEKAYVLTYTASQDTYENLKPVVDPILNSFTLKL